MGNLLVLCDMECRLYPSYLVLLSRNSRSKSRRDRLDLREGVYGENELLCAPRRNCLGYLKKKSNRKQPSTGYLVTRKKFDRAAEHDPTAAGQVGGTDP